MKISSFAKLALCATMLVSVSLKAEEAKDFYVQLNGGLSSGLAPKGGVGTSKMGRSALYGVELGYQIDENFRVGFGVDYRHKYSFKKSVTEDVEGTNTTEPETTNSSYKVNSLVAMVNGYYDIIEINGFTPYATLGAGIARNQLKTSAADTLGGPVAVPTKRTTNFAYKLGLGTRYNLNQSVAFDARYQFANLGTIKTGSSAQFEAEKGKLRAHEFLVGVAYKF